MTQYHLTKEFLKQKLAIAPFQIYADADSPTASFPVPTQDDKINCIITKKFKFRWTITKSMHTFTLFFFASCIASSLEPSTCVAGSANIRIRSR